MKIVSCNRGKKKSIYFRGKEVRTGIYKYPVDGGIVLTKNGVIEDAVIDLRFHGGVEKAVYLYSVDHYVYWKALYPDLEWTWGMFGENLTVEGMDEAALYRGEQYLINDEVLIEITTAREPCYKLGYKMGNTEIIQQFMNLPYPGVYARVIREGQVRPGDQMTIYRKSSGAISIADQYLTKMKRKQQNTSK